MERILRLYNWVEGGKLRGNGKYVLLSNWVFNTKYGISKTCQLYITDLIAIIRPLDLGPTDLWHHVVSAVTILQRKRLSGFV